MEMIYIIVLVLYSIVLGALLTYLFLINTIKKLKKLRFGDLKGIVVRQDIIDRLKAENKELIGRVKELEEQEEKIK